MKNLLLVFILFISHQSFSQNTFEVGFNLLGIQTQNISAPNYHNGRYIINPLQGVYFKIHSDNHAFRGKVTHLNYDMDDFYSFRFEDDTLTHSGDFEKFNFSLGYQKSFITKKIINLYYAADLEFSVTNLEEKRFDNKELNSTLSVNSKGLGLSGLVGFAIIPDKSVSIFIESGLTALGGLVTSKTADSAGYVTNTQNSVEFDLLFAPVSSVGVGFRF